MAQAPGFQRVPTVAPSPQVSVPACPATNTAMIQQPREKYKTFLSKLGIAEILIGSFSCLFALFTLAYLPGFNFGAAAQVLWCGALMIVSGILGVKAKSRPSVCIYNANMALAIIASVFMGILAILSGISASVSYYYTPIFLIIISILATAGTVIGIVHSAYCCAGVCSQGKYQGGVVYIPENHYIQHPQQMVQLANGQYMLVQAQPMMTAVPQHPMASIPVTASPVPDQPAQTEQQQVSQPSSSTGAQASSHTKRQESQVQGFVESPPAYSLLPSHNE